MNNIINFNNTHSYNEILKALTDLNNNGLFEGYKLGIDELDEVIRLDKGMLATITGIPNRGKSEFTDFICTQLNKRYGFKTLFFSAEDSLMIHLNKLIDKYNFADNVSIEDKAKYMFNNFGFINYDKIYKVEDLFNCAEKEIINKNYSVLVIDPFNKLEAQKEYNVNMTDYISKFLDKLLRFTKRNNIITLLVAHPRKINNTFNDYIPTAYDIADSAHFFNKSDYCITVNGDKETFTTLIKIDKIKYKHLGLGGNITLNYDDMTGNFYYKDVTKPIYNEQINNYSLPKFTPQLDEVTETKDYLDITVDYFDNITDTTPKERNLKKLLIGNSHVQNNNIINHLKLLTYGSAEYKKIKSTLGNFCINARFNNTRSKENIKELTNLCYIDIDLKDNENIINEIPNILKNISNVAFYKHSASGKGYFCIIPYTSGLDFKKVWLNLQKDFKDLGITIDNGTKNPDRVTFYSNDADYYINPNVEVYNKELDEVKRESNIITPQHNKMQNKVIRNDNNNVFLNNLIKWLENNNKCLDNGNYSNWEKVCLALISEYSNNGLDYFLKLSKNCDSFNENDATEFYNEHLNRYEDNNNVTFGTIKHLANEIGFTE